MARYKLPLEKAREHMANNQRLKALVQTAGTKAVKNRDRLADIWQDLQALFRLISAWVKRKYTVVPWQTMVRIVAAVTYFVNPFDVIPDFLGALGFIDDISVIAFVVSSFKDDIEAFKKWESGQTTNLIHAPI